MSKKEILSNWINIGEEESQVNVTHNNKEKLEYIELSVTSPKDD
jgi:hypothetical protein